MIFYRKFQYFASLSIDIYDNLIYFLFCDKPLSATNVWNRKINRTAKVLKCQTEIKLKSEILYI